MIQQQNVKEQQRLQTREVELKNPKKIRSRSHGETKKRTDVTEPKEKELLLVWYQKWKKETKF